MGSWCALNDSSASTRACERGIELVENPIDSCSLAGVQVDAGRPVSMINWLPTVAVVVVDAPAGEVPAGEVPLAADVS
jgi:hypothetical protein